MQRYGAFLWSGDVYSTWETLKTHVPGRGQHGALGDSVLGHRHRRVRADAGVHRRAARPLVPVRHVLSVVPRARPHVAPALAVGLEHGQRRHLRSAQLHRRRRRSRRQRAAQRAGRADREEVPRAALPAAAVHLHDGARVLRHRSADDARALAAPSGRSAGRGARRPVLLGPRHPRLAGRREGRDVAPPVSARADTGSTSGRKNASPAAARSTRPVDLETMPLHVRAGTILPLGPVKQYVDEPVDGPLSIVVYPGADGAFTLYEDDGKTFDYRRGEWMRIVMSWNDAARRLSLRLAPGSASDAGQAQHGSPRGGRDEHPPRRLRRAARRVETVEVTSLARAHARWRPELRRCTRRRRGPDCEPATRP